MKELSLGAVKLAGTPGASSRRDGVIEDGLEMHIRTSGGAMPANE